MDFIDMFGKFGNLDADVSLSMYLYEKDIKSLDEAGKGDIRGVDVERRLEFGICDNGDKVEISFEFGKLEVDRKVFLETIKRYKGRRKLIRKLKNY